MRESSRIRHLLHELKEHLPYTFFSVAIGIVIIGILTFVSEVFGSGDISLPSQGLFHIFHPLHVLFSAAATAAMFYRYERRVFKASLIGFIGSVAICGISDTFLPFISGILLGVKMHLHICILEHPHIILPFAVSGIFAGLLLPDNTHKGTIFSHSGHVLISSMASILYLIGFGLTEWLHVVGMVFVYMALAVIIPCCTSDIVFPLLLTTRRCTQPQ